MEIYTLPANKELEHCIRKITVFQSDDSSNCRQKLTPTPYSCLTYNHYHIPDFEVDQTVFISSQKLQVTGPKTRDDLFALHHGKLCQVLIEFSAMGFYFLFGQSSGLFLNTTVPLEKLNPNHTVQKLLSDLGASDEPDHHAQLIQRFLNAKECFKFFKSNYLIKSIQMIEESGGNLTVSEICHQVNISDRQLNRKFLEITGLKPLQFIKLKQLHYIINLLHKNQFTSLKELAYETGFYDPAHFNNHFKKLTGMSPGTFLSSDEHIAFKYYNDLVKE